MFLWKFLNLALPLGQILSDRLTMRNPECSLCRDKHEDAMNMLFKCHFARMCWFTSPVPLKSDCLAENPLRFGPISGYGKEVEVNGEKDPITRDLLGGCPVMDAKDLDLSLGIGSGSARDKGFDILPGKMYLRSNSSTNNNHLQDLNLPPSRFQKPTQRRRTRK